MKSLQKNVFIYDVLFILYFYDTYFRNVRTLLCFSVCIQLVPKKHWLCICSRWRREGRVGSQCLPSVKHVGALAFHVWLSRYLSKTASYRGLQDSTFSCLNTGMEILAGCFPLRLVLCPCTAQLSNSWLPVKLWNVEQLQTHHVPLSAGTIGHWTELLIPNYSVCTDNDRPGAIIRYKKALKQIYRPSSIFT